MSIVTQVIGFIFISLIVINGILGGSVVDAVGTFTTAEEKEQARLDLSCGLGYMMYKPVQDVGGINIPMPSYTNVFIAAAIALSIILIIRITTGIDWEFKYSIIVFVLTWIGIKVLGYTLMMYAGNDCTTWADEMFNKTSGIYDVAAAGGSLYFLKIVWGLRK